MKKPYEKPEIELTEFEIEEDITTIIPITTSTAGLHGMDGIDIP